MKHFIGFEIILCLCFCNCHAQRSRSNILGVYFHSYMTKGYSYPVGTINLGINGDGTYVYEERSGWQLEYSKGYWSLDSKKKKLFLKGVIPSVENMPIIVKEQDVEDDFIHVVFNPTFRDTTQWSVVLNDKDYPITPDSVFFLKDINKVDSFFIKGFLNVEYMSPLPNQRHVRSLTYYPQRGYNFYDISFPDSIDYHIFNYVSLQDTLDIKGLDLIWNRKSWKKAVKLKKRN